MAEIETVHRTCPLCEAHCGIAVEVDRDRQEVVSIRGDAEDPRSRGYLCPKAHGLKGLHEDPDRLRRPLRRVGPPDGDDWEELGWEEALDLVAGRLDEIRQAHGADAVATYLGNPNAHDLGSILYGPVFQRALGTRWRFSASSVDQLPKMVSCSQLFGSHLAFPVPDVDHTDYLLMLGANPLVSNGSLMTAPDMRGRLRRLRQRGGRLVVVDPRRSETARVADRHLAIRPGTDALLLFALVHVLFEEGRVAPGRLEAFTRGLDELRTLAKDFPPDAVARATGLDAAAIREVARELTDAPRAAVYGRIGTCTQAFGTTASWLVDVLNVLTGNLDRPGGVCFPRGAASPADDTPKRRRAFAVGRWRSRVRGLPEFAGELPVATLAEEIDTPGPEGERVRALVTLAGNPVLSTPNGTRLARALESLEFMVAVDLYRNETTRFADVILPPVGPLERSNYDLVFDTVSVRNLAKFSPAVFPRPADGREQWEILLELGARVNGATAEQVEGLLLDGLLGSTVGRPGTACPDVAPEAARAALGDEPGPERLLDLMLRAGPWGDRLDPASDGLSLNALRERPHGVDLGPLQGGRLPRILATESGAIELAPPVLTADVPRLRARLSQPDEALVLVGRRQVRTNNSWMHNVHALAKGPDRCVLWIHPDDGRALGLEDGGRARVRSRVGEVTAPVRFRDEMRRGVVSLPHGFGHEAPGVRLGVARAQAPGVNSNLLTDEGEVDPVSGNAVLNGIPVGVAPA